MIGGASNTTNNLVESDIYVDEWKTIDYVDEWKTIDDKIVAA